MPEMSKIIIFFIYFPVLLLSCRTVQTQYHSNFYRGVDLSYVNEMEDHGALYRMDGEIIDPYSLFHKAGANLVRIRLWNNPDWTDYSNFSDAARSLARAKENGMAVLLDFHYSDEWADPSKQFIPASWKELDENELAHAVYDYTYETLQKFYRMGLLPEYVQIGNETNSGMLTDGKRVDWKKQALLFNAGIQAAEDLSRETGLDIGTVLHVAQPENAFKWFVRMDKLGVVDYDIIGLSYYPQWSRYSIDKTGETIARLRSRFVKELMIVETAYPWTLKRGGDMADNVLTRGIREYPVSPDGQNRFMIDLVETARKNGASAVIYWEPAWVVTDALTLWGKGSHWENATFFTYGDNELHDGALWLGLTNPEL